MLIYYQYIIIYLFIYNKLNESYIIVKNPQKTVIKNGFN